MKRWIGSLILACVAAAAMAQAPFTIVRPVDNSKVREKVRVLIPKDSIPPGGYVGIFLNGKLVTATVPPVVGKYREFVLDTKGRGIADTEPGKPAKLEMVLYVDFNEQPRIVDRSSVEINISNKANIPVPEAGIRMRYAFKPGSQWIYNLEQRISVSTLAEDQARAGARANEFPLDAEKVRLLYSVDSAYGNGDGLLRMQALPTKGKDYAVLTVDEDEGAKRYDETDMAPLYMRVNSFGEQKFGSVPVYFPLEGTSGEGSILHLYANFPLPLLPQEAKKPGDSWQTNFQQGKLDMDNLFNQTNLVEKMPARGEFLGLEWEMGHPCAKIRHTISATRKDRGADGSVQGENKFSTTETFWFALDTRKVMRMVRDIRIEGKGSGMGAFGAGAGPAAGGGAPAGGPVGAPGMTGGKGGELGGPQQGDRSLRQKAGIGGGQGSGAPALGAPGGAPGRGAPGMGAPGGGMAGGGSVVIRILQIFTLER